MGNRVVVPPSLCQKILQQLHYNHLGISRMKSLDRMFVWWPGFDQEVEEVICHYDICQRSGASPPDLQHQYIPGFGHHDLGQGSII